MAEPGSTLPLRGVRVVEFAEGIAAPYAAQILAHLGADVLKVERPDGDWLRETARASFVVVNKGKRGITLDVKTAAGRQALWELVGASDVLVTNYRATALERLGITWAEVHQAATQVVFAQLSAYDDEGPLAAVGGTDTILQAVAGLMDQIGAADGEPTRVGFPLVDLVAARDLAAGVLAALLGRALHRDDGRHVRVSLFGSASSLLMEAWQRSLSGQATAPRSGNQNAVHAPGGVYPCGGGSLLALITLRNSDWARLCTGLGIPAVAADPRFASNDLRVRHRAALDPLVADVLRARPASEWVPRLRAAGITCGVVHSVESIQADDELRSLVPTVELSGPGAPAARALAVPIRLDGLSAVVAPAPPLGAQDAEGWRR